MVHAPAEPRRARRPRPPRLAPARADARPLPGRRRASSSATASGRSTRSTATGEPTILLHADLVDHPLAALEAADPLSRASLPGGHVRRRAATAARTARPTPRPTPTTEFVAGRPGGHGCDRHGAGGDRRACRWAAHRVLLLAAEHPDRVGGAVFIGAAVPPRSTGTRAANPGRPASTTGVPTDEGWAQVQRHYWRRDFRGLPRVLLRRADLPEPHSTKPIEDASAGPSRPIRDPDPERVRRVAVAAASGARATSPRQGAPFAACPLPVAGRSTATDDHISRSRVGERLARAAPARRWSSSRAAATSRRLATGPGEPADPRLRARSSGATR